MLINTFSFSVSFSSLGGLMLILQLPSGLAPLIYTKKSESIPALFLRYLATTEYVQKWYNKDIVNTDGEGFKAIQAVRSMHKNIFEKMNKTFPPEEKTGHLWVSQLSMTCTQWAFIGLLLMMPKKCGLHGKERTDELLENLIYLWRVLGYLNGISDEFNMCNDSVDETIQLTHLIYRDIFQPVLAEGKGSPIGYNMSVNLVTSLRPLLAGKPSADMYFTYWYTALGIDSSLIPKLTNKRMKLKYTMMKGILSFPYPFLGRFFYYRIKRRQKRTIKDKMKIHQKMQKKYPQVLYTMDEFIEKEHGGNLTLSYEGKESMTKSDEHNLLNNNFINGTQMKTCPITGYTLPVEC